MWRTLSVLRARLPAVVTPQMVEHAHRVLANLRVQPLGQFLKGARPYEDVVWLFMTLEQAENLPAADLTNQWVCVPRAQSDKVAAQGGAKHTQFDPKAAAHPYCVRLEIILGSSDDSQAVSGYVYVHDPRTFLPQTSDEIIERVLPSDADEDARKRVEQLMTIMSNMTPEEALHQCAAVTGMDPHAIQLWCQNHIRRCAQCLRNGVGFKVCSGCRRVHYCSPECQRAHWRAQHRDECSK